MPKFEPIAMETLRHRMAAGGDASKRLEAYLDFLTSLDAQHGGQATLLPGESALTVQRNLKAAAGLLSRTLVMRRAGETISFYLEDGRGRRGRRKPPSRSGRGRQAKRAE